jgi:dihydromethanopterin reductase (acceptor)
MKIAWGITGAGYLLSDCVEIIGNLAKQGNHVDIFISAAGEKVLQMYGLLETIHTIPEIASDHHNKIYYEKDQSPAFPICARFNLHYYDILVLAPLTANSVAKINVGIADTLITNIFAQMIKGSGNVLILPSDIIAGEIETDIPGNQKIKIHIDPFNAQNAQSLIKFPNTKVVKTIDELLTHLV